MTKGEFRDFLHIVWNICNHWVWRSSQRKR